MALLKRQSGNVNISRVNSILEKQGLREGEEPQEEPVVDEPQDEPVVDTQEPTQVVEEVEKPQEIVDDIKEEPVEKPEVDIESTPVAYDNDSVLNYLKENFGFEGENIEEALKPKTVEPELPENLKILKEWSDRTGLDISQWPDYNKDYKSMSDLDVAREILVQKYPDFTEEELEAELDEFVETEYDEHKDKVKKSKNLKKFAAEGRKELEKLKVELKPASVTSEQAKKLEFADQMRAQLDEAEQSREVYEKSISQSSLNFEGLSIKLSDDISITHKLDDKGKKELINFVKAPTGWYNKDGSPNYDNIVKDGVKLKEFDTMIAKAYNQGRTDEKAGTLQPQQKPEVKTVPQPSSDTSSKGNVREVVSNLRGGNRPKLRFRKS